MSNTTHESVARRLRQAYTGGAVPPLRDALDPLDGEAAYAIQKVNTRFWKGQGRKIAGHKAGLTAETVQQQLGVDQPDYGVLFEDMRIASGGHLDAARTIQPKVEGEIAFILSKDMFDPETDFAIAMDAIASVHAAIEVVDSRIADWKITFADTVADNGSSAFFAISEEGMDPQGLDMTGATMTLNINGDVRSQGKGSAVLGHPANALAWLARTLARQGEPLRAGDIVLAGALGPMVELKDNDSIEVLVDNIGKVNFTFGKA